MSTKIQSKTPHLRNPFTSLTIDVEDAAGSLVEELVRLAVSELERGNVEQAEHYLQQGLSRDPKAHRCQAYLAVCQAVRDPKSRSAERSARKIVDQQPNDPIGYFALGQVCLLGSRRRKAFLMFKQARRLAAREKDLRQQLKLVEPRRESVFPSLSRNHPLNVYGGRIRAFFSCWLRR